MSTKTDIHEAVEALRSEDELRNQLAATVSEAIAAPAAPVFNTHSQALAGRLIAEQRALIEIVADIDAQLGALNAQRTDAMLAQSGITNALAALERGK